MSNTGLSLIYPVYNEADILLGNLRTTVAYLDEQDFKWEIILVNNGSTDSSKEILDDITRLSPHIKVINLDRKGLGLAIKAGIQNSSFDIAMFYAIDLPFGLKIIEESYRAIQDNDIAIAIGSKSHPDSINKAPLKRKFVSRIYNLLLRTLFKLKIKDTQGSLIFDKRSLASVLPYCEANDPFYCTQMVIYSVKLGLKVAEIPVIYNSPRQNSKINMIKDSSVMLNQLINEYLKFKRLQA
ncbi:glycosyltransferase [Candidatus Peregrinibacteria bacterium]|nr:glycosyltransferase [Candidatus Peregrinibacteria bacterium]